MRRLLPLLTVLAVSCGALRGDKITPENAAEELAAAEADHAAGRPQRALDRLVELRGVRGLAPDQRLAVEELSERASREVLDGLLEGSASADSLEDLYGENLSPRVRARTGVLAADRMLAEGRPIAAFKMVRKVERDLPSYVDRARAGDVVGRAGLQLIRTPGRYYLLFRYASRGRDALEFLVVQYPFDPRCPEAYVALVDLYSARLDRDRAIERAEDLVIYHPETPEAIRMLARLPGLRLDRLERDDNDRSEMVQARSEIEFWLERYAGREGRPEDEALARATLRECQRRLAQNDLDVARFYRRVSEPQGLRLHAERALVEARAAEAGSEAAQAERLLAEFPEARPPGGEPTP